VKEESNTIHVTFTDRVDRDNSSVKEREITREVHRNVATTFASVCQNHSKEILLFSMRNFSGRKVENIV
jgi:hypothetical protein